MWNEFEYSKFKLLLNEKKVNSIFNVLNSKKEYDDLSPISIELHLTNNCNLNCPWCTDKELKLNKDSLDKSIVFNLLDYCSKNNIGITVEGGGEPTLHKDFNEIIRYGYEKNVHMGLISNGTKDISSLIRYFKWVRVSLDSSSSEEYKLEKGVNKFDVVLNNLNNFSKNRDFDETHLGIGYVITNRNLSNISSIIDVLDDMKIDYLYLRPVEETPNIEPTLNELFELRKLLIDKTSNKRIKFILNINERMIKDNDNLPCVAHSVTCTIHANGEIALCEKRRHSPIILGNLNNNTFDEIWHSPLRKEISQCLLNPKQQIGCEVCRLTSFNQIFCDVNSIHTRNFI